MEKSILKALMEKEENARLIDAMVEIPFEPIPLLGVNNRKRAAGPTALV